MGTSTRAPAPSEKDRAALARAALRDGTVPRVRHLMNWSVTDLAQRLDVLPTHLAAWENGEGEPPAPVALRLWTLLVGTLRYEGASRPPTPPPGLL